MRKEKRNELLAYQSMHQGSFIMDGEVEDEKGEQVFNETAKEQEARIRRESPFGHLATWKLLRIIVKSNDDVRQEQFAMQLISQIYQIFKIKKLPLWLKTYEILATGPNCGLIEVICDAMSIDEIHKKAEGITLLDYFVVYHGKGKIKSKRFKRA